MNQRGDFINCSFVTEETVRCNGTDYTIPERRLTYHDHEFWIYIGIYTGLVLIAGLMSGLTMGLLSLDPTTLAVLRDGGTEKEKKYAKRILPLVQRHHLLLVTLLLTNAAAVEAMPIFLDHVSDPVIAVVVSVTAVLIFGEVIPQAVCTRFGLAIGAVFSPLVYVLIVLLFIVAWPFSKVLDCLLGEDHGTFYRRAQLKVLVDLHGPAAASDQRRRSRSSDQAEEHLTVDEVLIIKGALDMKSKTACTAMVPIASVYMVDVDAKLDADTMTDIITRGHSRIPVYAGDRSNVVGLLLTKTLIKLNPADCTPIARLMEFSVHVRPPMFVDESIPLFDLLNQFQTGRSHLAFVQKSMQTQSNDGGSDHGKDDDSQPLLKIDEPHVEHDVPELVGVITLEDVLEELLQEEIRDETDVQKMQEMGGMLQTALAKAVTFHKKVNQPRSQSQAFQESGNQKHGQEQLQAQDGSPRYGHHQKELSSQPQEMEQRATADLEVRPLIPQIQVPL